MTIHDTTGYQAPMDEQVAAALRNAAEMTGVPVHVLYGVAWVESRFNPRVESPVGARGLMQLMPATFAEWMRQPKPWPKTWGAWTRRTELDPWISAEYGASELARALAWADGDLPTALAFYNWGLGSMTRIGWPEYSSWRTRVPTETANYIARVHEAAGLQDPGTGTVFAGGVGQVLAVGFVLALLPGLLSGK